MLTLQMLLLRTSPFQFQFRLYRGDVLILPADVPQFLLVFRTERALCQGDATLPKCPQVMH